MIKTKLQNGRNTESFGQRLLCEGMVCLLYSRVAGPCLFLLSLDSRDYWCRQRRSVEGFLNIELLNFRFSNWIESFGWTSNIKVWEFTFPKSEIETSVWIVLYRGWVCIEDFWFQSSGCLSILIIIAGMNGLFLEVAIFGVFIKGAVLKVVFLMWLMQFFRVDEFL